MERTEDRLEVIPVLGPNVLVERHGDGFQGGGEERDHVWSRLSFEGENFQQFDAREERYTTGFGEEDWLTT